MEGAAMTFPIDIYQSALNAVSDAVMTRNFADYLQQLDLPYLMTTAKAQFVLNDREELERNFHSVSGSFQRRGVTHYERLVRSASLVRSDRIEGWHYTHIIANGERLTAPWLTRQALVRREAGWRFSEVHFPFQTDRLPLTEEDIFGSFQPSPPASGLPGMSSDRMHLS